MSQIKLILAILSFLHQFLKWMNKDESGGKVKVKIDKFLRFKKALEKAETTGESDELEQMFKIIKP